MTPLILIAAVTLAVALAVALAAALLLALCSAVVAACAWTWVTIASARYERLLARRYEPLPPSRTSGRRHGRPQLDPAAVDADEYWTAAREASAEAAVEQTLVMTPAELAAFDWEPVGGAR